MTVLAAPEQTPPEWVSEQPLAGDPSLPTMRLKGDPTGELLDAEHSRIVWHPEAIHR